jgi:hypothetical protein
VPCGDLEVTVDVSGFAVQVGRDAHVGVQVSCTVPLGEQAVPGLPGSRTLSAHAVSPLDRFRSR